MEVVLTTVAIRRAKLQSNRHHQQTSTKCFTGPMPVLSPNQQCQSRILFIYGPQCSSSPHSGRPTVVAANQDQNGGQFLLLRPVIMRVGLACVTTVWPESSPERERERELVPTAVRTRGRMTNLLAGSIDVGSVLDQQPGDGNVTVVCGNVKRTKAALSTTTTGHFTSPFCPSPHLDSSATAHTGKF